MELVDALLDARATPGLRRPGPERAGRRAGHDGQRITAAFWAACGSGNQDIAELLLAKGADINWIGWGEKAALDQAHKADAEDLAAWLAGRGALPARELA
jgi:uncharacterized protein